MHRHNSLIKEESVRSSKRVSNSRKIIRDASHKQRLQRKETDKSSVRGTSRGSVTRAPAPAPAESKEPLFASQEEEQKLQTIKEEQNSQLDQFPRQESKAEAVPETVGEEEEQKEQLKEEQKEEHGGEDGKDGKGDGKEQVPQLNEQLDAEYEQDDFES